MANQLAQVAPSERSARIFRIAENSQTDDEVFERIICEMQDGSWTIDERGAVVGPWLAEELDEVDHGEDYEEQGDEDSKDDRGNEKDRYPKDKEEVKSGEGDRELKPHQESKGPDSGYRKF